MTDSSILPENAIGNPINQTIVYTQAYLDNPIEFFVDQKLISPIIIEEVLGPSLQSRDLNGFVFTDINSQTTKYYPIQVYSSLYDRNKFSSLININFGFF